MKNLIPFYDRYHLKNKEYGGVISRNNFTYFYMLQLLQKACKNFFGGSFRDKKVLDVGCGVGTISMFLADQGCTVTGVDISSRAIKIAIQAKKDSSIPTKKLQFKKGQVADVLGTYDLVICSEIIEHIENDLSFLHTISKKMNSDAVLILTTPSKENILFRLGYYKKFDREVGHLRRYTKKSLSELLEKNGFKSFFFRETEGPLRNILFTSKFGIVIRFIKGPFVPIFHAIDSVFGILFGFSDLQVIAIKKK